jgi:hypothetical protein
VANTRLVEGRKIPCIDSISQAWFAFGMGTSCHPQKCPEESRGPCVHITTALYQEEQIMFLYKFLEGEEVN